MQEVEMSFSFACARELTHMDGNINDDSFIGLAARVRVS